MAKKKKITKMKVKKTTKKASKRTNRKKPILKIGSIVWIDDEEDSGNYEVSDIDAKNDTCWLHADIPTEEDPEMTRSVEQEFPLSWIERIYKEQN